MNMFRMAVVVAMGALALNAGAGIYTQTLTYGPESPTYSGSLVFNQYSGSETVTQVVVRATLTANNYSMTADNEGQAQSNLSYTLGTKNITYLAPVDETRVLSATTSGTFSLGADDGDGTGVQTDGTDWAQFTATGLETVWTKTYTAGITGFIGSGTFNWNYEVNSNYSVSGGPTLLVTTGTGGGQMQVTFYTIPEPATMSILAMSGLAFVVRRRRLYSLPV